MLHRSESQLYFQIRMSASGEDGMKRAMPRLSGINRKRSLSMYGSSKNPAPAHDKDSAHHTFGPIHQ